jgi:hypothetical protein
VLVLRALVLVLTLALPSGARAQGEPAELTDATVIERDGAVEVWVRLSRPVKYQTELMDGPFRLVIDFQDTAYRWTTRPVPVTIEPVRELRGSQFRKGVARIVVELRRKMAYTIEEDREGLRIVLPLVYGVIMLDGQAHAYIFDPTARQVRRYAVGDALGNTVVETIAERRVVLKTPTGRLELRLDAAGPAAAPSR